MLKSTVPLSRFLFLAVVVVLVAVAVFFRSEFFPNVTSLSLARGPARWQRKMPRCISSSASSLTVDADHPPVWFVS